MSEIFCAALRFGNFFVSQRVLIDASFPAARRTAQARRRPSRKCTWPQLANLLNKGRGRSINEIDSIALAGKQRGREDVGWLRPCDLHDPPPHFTALSKVLGPKTTVSIVANNAAIE